MKGALLRFLFLALIFVEIFSASIKVSWPDFMSISSSNGNRRRGIQSGIIFSPTTPLTTPTTTTVASTSMKPTEPSSTSTTETIIACDPGKQPPASSQSIVSEDFIRRKLCGNGTITRNYRFDLEAKICSQVGKQSHCGKNMLFYSIAGNNLYGQCDCNYSSPIPLVYHAETNRCYFVYQKAYCAPDEWLEMRREDGKPICTKNKCYNSGRVKFGALPLASRDMEPEYVPFNGNGPCVKLYQSSELCKRRGDVVAFRWPLQFYPTCGVAAKNPPLSELPSVKFLGELPSLQCSPGSYLSTIGECQPEWDFD